MLCDSHLHLHRNNDKTFMSGETGENPVRARRRKAHLYYRSYQKPQF